MDEVVAGGPIRRKPKQDRSRERVDDILKVAKKLIGEKGVDMVTMREIAVETGGPIASVYQYFPNKSAILATIYAQFCHDMEAEQDRLLATLHQPDDPLRVAKQVLEIYFLAIQNDPAFLDVLIAVQADKALMDIDIAASRRMAERFSALAAHAVRPERQEAFKRVCFLMVQVSHCAIRLALHLGSDEMTKVIEDFNGLIESQWRLYAAHYQPGFRD